MKKTIISIILALVIGLSAASIVIAENSIGLHQGENCQSIIKVKTDNAPHILEVHIRSSTPVGIVIQRGIGLRGFKRYVDRNSQTKFDFYRELDVYKGDQVMVAVHNNPLPLTGDSLVEYSIKFDNEEFELVKYNPYPL